MKFIVKLLTQSEARSCIFQGPWTWQLLRQNINVGWESIECTSSLVVMLMLIYDSYIKKLKNMLIYDQLS